MQPNGIVYYSDDDPTIHLRFLKDEQGDMHLTLIDMKSRDNPRIYFRCCTTQGGGQDRSRKLWRSLLNLWNEETPTSKEEADG